MESFHLTAVFQTYCCWRSRAFILSLSISRATTLKPPSGTMISAYFLLGSTNYSCISFTVVRY